MQVLVLTQDYNARLSAVEIWALPSVRYLINRLSGRQKSCFATISIVGISRGLIRLKTSQKDLITVTTQRVTLFMFPSNSPIVPAPLPPFPHTANCISCKAGWGSPCGSSGPKIRRVVVIGLHNNADISCQACTGDATQRNTFLRRLGNTLHLNVLNDARTKTTIMRKCY